MPNYTTRPMGLVPGRQASRMWRGHRQGVTRITSKRQRQDWSSGRRARYPAAARAIRRRWRARSDSAATVRSARALTSTKARMRPAPGDNVDLARCRAVIAGKDAIARQAERQQRQALRLPAAAPGLLALKLHPPPPCSSPEAVLGTAGPKAAEPGHRPGGAADPGQRLPNSTASRRLRRDKASARAASTASPAGAAPASGGPTTMVISPGGGPAAGVMGRELVQRGAAHLLEQLGQLPGHGSGPRPQHRRHVRQCCRQPRGALEEDQAARDGGERAQLAPARQPSWAAGNRRRRSGRVGRPESTRAVSSRRGTGQGRQPAGPRPKRRAPA